MNIPAALRDRSRPALHGAKRKGQTPGPLACPRTGSNQAAPGLQVQHRRQATSPKESISPLTNSIYHKPMSKGMLQWAPRHGGTPERQADRHNLLGVQIDSNQVSPPFLPTAVNPTNLHN